MAESLYKSNLKYENVLELFYPDLCGWYQAEKRILPWREEKTAYRVWISEIMLQQTRVEAVKPYFERFIKRLPDAASLAEVSDEELNKLWEGLGYYSRAANLKKAAIQIMEQFDGELPADYEKLLTLSGVGSYTAGAIASFAFSLPVASVDGNVLRVMTRVEGNFSDISKASVKKYYENRITSFLQKNLCPPEIFNAAVMELGAIVCIPNGRPLCEKCPLELVCETRKRELYDVLPVKAVKKERKIEQMTVFLITDGKHVMIEKREKKGLLAGLYQYPNKSGWLNKNEAEAFVKEYFRKFGMDPVKFELEEGKTAKHIFSHIEWQMHSYYVRFEEEKERNLNLSQDNESMKALFINKEIIRSEYAIPSAFSAFEDILK